MIIEREQANDTLSIALAKPPLLQRFTYYFILILLVGAALWASLSIVDVPVHAVGSIRPAQGVQAVQSSVTSLISTLSVAENNFVQAGDTIAVLEFPQLSQTELLARRKIFRLEEEQADLNSLAKLIANAPFRLPLYERENALHLKERELYVEEITTVREKFNRSAELHKQNFISQEEYEQTKFQLQQKELALQQWEQNFQRSVLERLQKIELEIAVLQSDLRSTLAEKAKYVLKSPVSGYVSKLNFKSNRLLVKAGEVFCIVSPTENQTAEFYITAKDAGFVKEGLTVRYQLDAFPFQEWGMLSGKVQSVAKDFSLDEKTQSVMFRVVGGFDGLQIKSARTEQVASVKIGMTYRANIVVAEKRLIQMLWDKSIEFFALQ